MISVSAAARELQKKLPSPTASANPAPDIEVQLLITSDYCSADTPLLDNPPSMTQPTPPGAPAQNLNLQGGAAIVAPVSAFPGGVPGNALIVLPLSQPSDELTAQLKQGPLAI